MILFSFDKKDFSEIEKNEPLEEEIIEDEGTVILDVIEEDVEMTSILETPIILEESIPTEIKNTTIETPQKSKKKKGLFLETIPEEGLTETKKSKGFLWILIPLIGLAAAAYFLMPSFGLGKSEMYYYSVMKNGANIQVAEKDSTERPYHIANIIENYYSMIDDKNMDGIKSHLASNMDRYYDHNNINNSKVIDLYAKYNNKLIWTSNKPIWETMDITEKEKGSFEVKFSMNYEIMLKNGDLKKYLEDLVIVVDKNFYFKSIYLMKSKKLN